MVLNNELAIQVSISALLPAGGDLVDVLKQGTNNMKNANNSCGRSDNIGAAADYLGFTSASVNAPNGTHLCNESGDGINVVSFGDVGGGWIGMECRWSMEHSGYDKIEESDIRLDAGSFWTVNPSSPSCSQSYSVEAVMTHERGHTFGLGHVAEDTHGNLTMSTAINGTCENGESSLGLGDMLGLEVLY